MIYELPPGASALASAAAAFAYAAHITGGLVGIGAGTVAMIARKGGPLHRRAGQFFLVSMLVMSATGALIAPLLPDRGSTIAGWLSLYLVATGWMAARRPAGKIGLFERWALIWGATIAAFAIMFGLRALGRSDGMLDGKPAAAFFLFATIATVATVMDLRLNLIGGLAGAARLTRHLWRLVMAWWLALTSFFLGQMPLFPAPIRASGVLFLPSVMALVLLVYWLGRVRRRATPNAGPRAVAGTP